MWVIRFILSILLWVLFHVLIFIPLCLLGWILIPLAAAFKAYKSYEGEDGIGTPRVQWRFTWPFMFVWDNYEDGIANDTYWKAPNLFSQIVYWSAIRNPVNNLRIVPFLSCKINPAKVCFVGSFYDLKKRGGEAEALIYENKNLILKYDTKTPHWFFAWHGVYSNFFWQFNLFGKLRRFWIGWKIMPDDTFGVSEYRQRGAGFALQFKVVK